MSDEKKVYINQMPKRFDDDLDYVCCLLCEIAYETDNSLCDVIKYFNRDLIKGTYELAHVYHCDSYEYVASEFIENLQIPSGSFERNKVKPDSIELGQVFGYLIYDLVDYGNSDDMFNCVLEVFGSETARRLEDTENAMYWQSQENIYHYYVTGEIRWF